LSCAGVCAPQWYQYQLKEAVLRHDVHRMLDLAAAVQLVFAARFARRRTTSVAFELEELALVVTAGATAVDKVPALIGKSTSEKANDVHGNRLLSHDQVANLHATDNGSMDAAWLFLELQIACGHLGGNELALLPLGAMVPCEAASEGGRCVDAQEMGKVVLWMGAGCPLKVASAHM
jgi:hypothetical protein